jgi:hypothetical protein
LFVCSCAYLIYDSVTTVNKDEPNSHKEDKVLIKNCKCEVGQ